MTKADQLVENLEYLRKSHYALGIYYYMDGGVEVTAQSGTGNFPLSAKDEGADLFIAIKNLTNQIKDNKNGQTQKYNPNQATDNQPTGGLDW